MNPPYFAPKTLALKRHASRSKADKPLHVSGNPNRKDGAHTSPINARAQRGAQRLDGLWGSGCARSIGYARGCASRLHT